MRALTQLLRRRECVLILCRNEVTAREGIDTLHPVSLLGCDPCYSRNEVTAREGIDTLYMKEAFASFDNLVEMR